MSQPPQYFQFYMILQKLATSHKDMESIFPPLEPGWDFVASSTKRIWESGRLGGRRHDSHLIHMCLPSPLSQLSLLETSHHVKVTWRGHLWVFWLTAPCYQTCEQTDLRRFCLSFDRGPWLGFLNLSTMDILDQIIPCGICEVRCAPGYLTASLASTL